MEDKEPFLSRWSRRKLAAKEAAPASAAQAAELPAAGTGARLPEAGLPEDFGPEYREYFDPQVEEKLRRTALKKLFSDPQFNVMDGLDTYVDDYSKPDPIPEAMLRRLNQAKELFLFDEEKKADAGKSEDAGAAEASEPASTGDPGAPADAAAAGASVADAAPGPPAEPPLTNAGNK